MVSSSHLWKTVSLYGLLRAQQVKYDSGQLVGRGCDRLRFAELAGDAAEELAQIVFGMMQRLRAHAQGSRNPASDASAFGEQHLAAADLLLGAQPEPRCESGGISEPGNIRADLTEDRLGCDCADARHIRQIHSEDSIQFCPKIECLSAHSRRADMAVALVRAGVVGSAVAAVFKLSQLELNLLIHFKNELLIITKRRQRLAKCEEVLWTIVAFE